jgi:hypothetical protein
MAGALQGTPDAPVHWSWLQRENVREVALRGPVGVCPCLILNSGQWRGTRVVDRDREQWR